MGKNNIRAKRAIILFFLFIFIILLILGLAIHTSRLVIEVENLRIDTELPKGEKINKDSKIILYLLIFRKFKLFKNDVRKADGQNIKFLKKDLDIKLLKNKDLKIDYKEIIKKPNIYIEKIDLDLQVGTQDAALTAILTSVLAAGLGMIIRKPQYQIIPVYANRNFLKIKLDGIFSIDLMQYIYKLISSKIKDLGQENLNKKVEV